MLSHRRNQSPYLGARFCLRGYCAELDLVPAPAAELIGQRAAGLHAPLFPGSAVPVAELCRHVGVGHEVVQLPARALVAGGQPREHIITVVAAQDRKEGRNPVGGNDVDPVVGGDRLTPKVADAGAFVMAVIRSVPSCSRTASRWRVPRSSRSSRKMMRWAAGPGRG